MNLLAILILSVAIRHEIDIEDWGDPSSQGYTAEIHKNYALNSLWSGIGAWAAEMNLEQGDFVQVWLTCHGVAEYHLTAFNLDAGEMVAKSWLPGDDYMEWTAGEEEPEPPVIPGGGGGGCGVLADGIATALSIMVAFAVILGIEQALKK